MKIAEKLNEYPIIEALIITTVLFTAIFIVSYYYPTLNTAITTPILP